VPSVEATVTCDNVRASILLNTNSLCTPGSDLGPASSVPSEDMSTGSDDPDSVISTNSNVNSSAWPAFPFNGSEGEACSVMDFPYDSPSDDAAADDGLFVCAGSCGATHSNFNRGSASNGCSPAPVNLSEFLWLFVARLQGFNSHCEHSER